MGKFLRNSARVILILFISSLSAGESTQIKKEHEPDTLHQKDGESQTVVVYHGFEEGIPFGWTQQYLSSPGGINAQWDTRTGAGLIGSGMIGDPDTAAVGNKNLVFQKQGAGYVTRLITAPIDLEFIVNPELSFYHAQVKWGDDQDFLVIYYRLGDTGDWMPLANYMFEVPVWTHRTIQLTDHETDKFYLAFEGISGHGSGVCIDEFTITETGFITKELNNFTTDQASHDFMPSGSINNPILQSRVRVTGNTDLLFLEEYIAHSKNTDDNDIEKVKLYFTSDESFHTGNLLAESNGFTNGVVTFSNINLELPTGYSYLWLTYDIAEDATHGNYGDAYIPAGGITTSDGYELLTDQDPPGRRIIYQTIFYDDFSTDKNWVLIGEFERDIPQGLGGSFGHPGASFAYTGTKVLGSDLTGLGAFPGDYEPELDTAAYVAISPIMDCYYFKDVRLTFHRWLNIEYTDKATIDVSLDGGITWEQIWINNNFMNALSWSQQSYLLKPANRQQNVRFRFTIGPTDATNNYSGWNIDNLVVTGTFVEHDVGISEWIDPQEGCGMSDSEIITVRVNNYGFLPVDEPIPLGFSLDNGQTWHMDTLYQDIPVEGNVLHTFEPKADFSTPGRYNVIVKPFWEKDQDAENDTLIHPIFSIPVITPPYSQNFISNDGLWTGYGDNNSWEWATVLGSHIDTAYTGTKAWVTNPNGAYNSLEASWLESPCFNFLNVENPVLEFYLYTHTPDGIDGATLQYSLDEGDTWDDLNILSEELAWNWYSDDDEVQMLDTHFGSSHGWHGNSEEWKRVRAVLESTLAEEERVKFRMLFASQDYGESHSWEGIGFDAVKIYESPHDIGVAAILDPIDACELSHQQSVTVSIENFGLNPLESGIEIPVGLTIDTIPTVYESFILEEDLLPGNLVEYTFDALFDMAEETTYQLMAFTLLPGDSDFYNPGVFNDTLSTTVTVFGYPEFVLGDDIYTTMPDTVVIDAGPGFDSYLWKDGSTEQTFHVTSIHSEFYTVWVTDFNGCTVSDSLEVITRDLEVYTISQPLSDCELSDEEYIEVQIRNAGPDVFPPGTEIPVQIFYNMNLLDEGIIILDNDLHPDQTVGIAFGNPVDFSEIGEYEFRIKMAFTDANPQNDTLDISVFVHGYPQPWIGDTIYNTDHSAVLLDAGEEYIAYLWQDGSTDQFFIPDNPWSDWYHVTVTDIHGCQGIDSVHVITYDIEIFEIVDLEEACELSESEPIVVKLINHGPETFYPGTQFPLIIEYQGEFLTEDTLVVQNNWEAGQELLFDFNAIINMSEPQTYDFRIYQRFRDANTSNDTLDFSVIVHGFPDIFLPTYITTDFPETVILEPGAGYTSYLWQDGSTEEVFHVETWGDYWVEVENVFGCAALAETQVLPELFDLALHDASLSDIICASGEEHPVRVWVKNTGNSQILPGTQLTLTYSFDGGAEVQETITLDSTISKDDIREFIFSQPVYPQNPGYAPINASVHFDGDEIPENDTFAGDVYINQLPQPDLGGNIYTLEPLGIILTPGDFYESYLWQDGSQESELEIQSLNSALYSVTVTDLTGCANTDSIMIVTYNLELDSVIAPLSNCTLSVEEPVIARVLNEGYDDFTAGSSISLGYSINGGSAVIENFIMGELWEKNSFMEFTFNTPANLSQTGNYQFRVFVDTPNAVPETDTILSFVEVPGLPHVDLGPDIYTAQLDTVVLNAGDGFASYFWQDGHSEQYYPVTSFGWKWVFVTDNYGCVGSDTIFVGFYTYVEDMMQDLASKIYPNPSSGIFSIELNSDIVIEYLNWEITDIRGNMVQGGKFFTDGLSRETLNVSFLQPGIYLLHLRYRNNVNTHKITIIR